MLLCGDIGGTKALLGLAEVDATRAPSFRYRRTLACADHADFPALLDDFLATARQAGFATGDIDGGCLAVAGPVEASATCARLTNLPWVIDVPALAERHSIPLLRLVNDFTAAAAGLDDVAPQDIVELQAGSHVEHGVRLIVGAGTGLGVAIQVWQEETGYRTLASEGGHGGFAPADAEQAALRDFLAARIRLETVNGLAGRVTNERVVSGPGLVAIYDFLCGRDSTATDRPDPRLDANPAAALAMLAAVQPDSLAQRALNLFCAAYGAVVGDLALTVLPWGGVYVAGGIAARILPQLRTGRFLAAFNDKAEHAALTARMPLRVLTDVELGLKGAARLAAAATQP